ncbi:hypothetical protein ACFLXZ_01045 [Chloroflexota bacterium]
MGQHNEPFGIECFWDSEYLCKKCGGLFYYDMETREDHCFNSQCPDYPKGIESYGTGEEDFKLLDSQFADIEKNLGQIVRTCDYEVLAQFLLERRRRIVQKFFNSGIMHIDSFLFSNEILLFIQKYKSLGIRKDLRTFKAILQLHKQYIERLQLIEDLKERRYLLAREPINNKMFRLKYYDVIVNEIWASYGLVNLQSIPDVNDFRYHEVIQKIVNSQSTTISTDYTPYFDRLWPFAISVQYLLKRNYSSALKYKYSVTATDLANILSIILSLKDDNLINVQIMNLLKHFIEQPLRDKNFTEFISMLSGNGDKIPIIFKTNGNTYLDRRTLLLFFMLMYSQHLPSVFDISGQQRMAQHKQEAGGDYEKYLKGKLEKIGYICLPTSTIISTLDYDVVAVSESNLEIILIEAKFKDPSPSSLSGNTLIQQELVYKIYGLLPQVIKHQERYDLLIKRGDLFQKKLGLKKNIQDYSVKAYFINKYTPLISCYGNVRVVSEREFIEKEYPILSSV